MVDLPPSLFVGPAPSLLEVEDGDRLVNRNPTVSLDPSDSTTSCSQQQVFLRCCASPIGENTDAYWAEACPLLSILYYKQ